MFKQTGYVYIINGDGTITERDFVKCRHCQKGIELKAGTWGQVYMVPDPTRPPDYYREESGCYCRVCMGPICPKCDDKGGCVPWQVKLEKEEARARLMQAIGL